MVSKASDDFPEPDSPVNTTSLSRGISTSMFLRLCSRAPRMIIARVLEPAVCWRFALITSSISAFPGALAAACVGARIFRKPGSDANGCARNIGRTRGDFQCSLYAINGLCGTGCSADAAGRQIGAQTKRQAEGRPFLIPDAQLRPVSVPRDDRAAPAVVDADGRHIDVLTDAVIARNDANRGKNRREVEAAVAHEQMMVLNRSRPVRRETKFETGSGRAAKAGFGRPVKHRAGLQTLVLVVGEGAAALHIPKHAVPGITDLASEQAQRIDRRSVGRPGNNLARVRSTQIGPVALCFQTEHHGAAQPTVTDLAAGDRTTCVVTAFSDGRINRNSEGARNIPAVVAPATAA